MTPPKPALVLGCGPSGLIAAHACALKGIQPVIYSRDAKKSELYGSQYLHKPIPEIAATNEGRRISYVNYGTPEEYRRKVHGEFWDGQIAPGDFIPHHNGWDIRNAYDRLWFRYERTVLPKDISGLHDVAEITQRQQYSIIISTLPRKLYCQEGDEFTYSLGWATSGDLARAICHGLKANTIVCDGTSVSSWSRASKVFGHCTVEWPWNEGSKPVYAKTTDTIARIVKPLRCKTSLNTGDSITDGGPPIVFAGRYGQWHKGVVVTDTWKTVNEALERYVL